MKTLYIIASPRGDMSKSIDLGNYAVEKIGGDVITLDVHKENVPYITFPMIALNYGFAKYEELSDDDKKIADLQNKYIEMIRSADNIVIAAPMWNFSMPAALKAWFDFVIKVNDTFSMEGGNYKGLVTNIKKAIVVGARGGEYIGTPIEGYDNLSSYIKGLLSFIGISSEGFWIEGVNKKDQETLEKEVSEIKSGIDTYLGM